MAAHDPLRFTTGLGAKLATRSRHVCTFFGAGTSKACGLPDIAQLQERVLARLDAGQRTSLARQLEGRNLEQGLSRLRRIAALLVENQILDGLTAQAAVDLDQAICRAVIAEVDIRAADFSPSRHFAAWLARTNYHAPVEVFTVNYDLLFETSLEEMRVPYFDGFIGNLRARFQTELVEARPGADSDGVPAFFARLWKLHGSVNWAWESSNQVVRIGQPVSEGMAAAIYPSDTKYEESRRVPFLVLQDRMRRALHQPETLVIVAGYSFGDAHLNELLFDAAMRRERTEIVVFCYSTIPDILAERALLTPNIQVLGDREAIIGGVRADWVPPEDEVAGIFEGGRFLLGDFQKLAEYLAKSTTRESDNGLRLRQLLGAVVDNRDVEAGD
ncbi:SIR2 family protein [Paraburkholderia aromaticivorans]|uniref:SIR2 family protein n=1 Tax=Paraburkholderia aromaticivorans TaxID=2026199 RepID=UPI00145603D3|nr:SIR2 family protein [Paraburkholderia aromaticivorans]